MNTLTLDTLATATNAQLVAFYNAKTGSTLKKFRTRSVGIRQCTRLLEVPVVAAPKAAPTQLDLPAVPAKPLANPSAHRVAHPLQRESMKLQREIQCAHKGKILQRTWKTPYAMWRAHPDWMTSAQLDALTRTLYAAVRQGYKGVTYEVNGRTFWLVNYVGPL